MGISMAVVFAVSLTIGALILNSWGFWMVDRYKPQLAGEKGGGNSSVAAVENFVSAFATIAEVPSGVKGAIMPHHLLVNGFIDLFYKKIAEKNKYDEIIFISPNHFDLGRNYVQTSGVIKGHEFNFDVEGIAELVSRGVAFDEPKRFADEHGVWTHEKFLTKYFPEAKFIPLIIKRQTPQEKLDRLSDEIIKLIKEKELNGKSVLIIGSLDFSHYSGEKESLENDRKTISWLGNLNEWAGGKMFIEAINLGISADKRTDAVGIDSPESLYLFAKIMQGRGSEKFALWNRTSTIALIPTTPDASNTSHIFGSFTN